MIPGDEWKRNPEPKKVEPTRAQLQHDVDSDYMAGVIPVDEWRRRTDVLSEPAWKEKAKW